MITIVMAYYENGGMLDRHIKYKMSSKDVLKDFLPADKQVVI